jgi:hypothetical protein
MEIIYWKELGRRLETLKAKKEKVSYRIAPFTQWKVIIADESFEVEKGRVDLIKLKEVRIPENTIIAPSQLPLMRLARQLTLSRRGRAELRRRKG